MGFSIKAFWRKLFGAEVDALTRENENLREMVKTLSRRVEDLESDDPEASGGTQSPLQSTDGPVVNVAPEQRAPVTSPSLQKPIKQSQPFDYTASGMQGNVQPGGTQKNIDDTMQLPKSALAPPLVLVVEDNLINQRVARLQLEELGCRVHIVSNGSEAIDAAVHLRYDLILMDCAMPLVDGYEATTRIRKQEALIGRRTPIIALTANSQPGDREKCLACGMDDYLSKPVSKADLRASVLRWVNSRGRTLPAPPSGKPSVQPHPTDGVGDH